MIVTSTVYRQSSVADPRRLAMDPGNQLYWRMPVRRLDAEIVRDRILAASGRLGSQLFGPAVKIKPDCNAAYHLLEHVPLQAAQRLKRGAITRRHDEIHPGLER